MTSSTAGIPNRQFIRTSANSSPYSLRHRAGYRRTRAATAWRFSQFMPDAASPDRCARRGACLSAVDPDRRRPRPSNGRVADGLAPQRKPALLHQAGNGGVQSAGPQSVIGQALDIREDRVAVLVGRRPGSTESITPGRMPDRIAAFKLRTRAQAPGAAPSCGRRFPARP